ncbi:MAG: RNA polymerase sigma factor [Oscillospiraceae bacterium]|nr:RNA polymerase sigma factor [Oscillospiraceae bacterium]
MYKKLCTIAYSALGSLMLAEEAVQEVFCIACKKPHAILSSRNPRGWLVRTLHYVVCNMKRTRTHQERLIAAAENEPRERIYRDDYTDVEYSDMLSEEEYRLFREVAVEQCSMREAAEERGISVEACKKRIQRIRRKLQLQFAEDRDA